MPEQPASWAERMSAVIADLQAVMPKLQVEITLTCESGHVMGTYTNICTAKYPLFCGQCEDTVEGKYPFTITTRITEGSP